MSANLEIAELSGALSFRVGESPRLWRIFFAVPFTAIAVYLIAHFTSSSRLLELFIIAVCVATSAKYLIADLRGTNVELRVTNLDLISTGRAPDGYSPASIPRASIYKLEYHEVRGGGEDEPHPSGLYVKHQGILFNPTTCVLPHIDESQTRQVIEVILRHFPDTESLAPVSPHEPYLTALNLNQ